MFTHIREILKFVRHEKIEQVDLKFTNPLGVFHHFTISTNYLHPDVIEKGVGFDSSTIPCLKRVEEGDMKLKIDVGSAFIDPFFKLKTLSFICDIVEADTGENIPSDPRSTAKKAQRILEKFPYVNRSLWGPEFEFYIFDKVRFKNSENTACYEIHSREAGFGHLLEGSQENEFTIHRGKGYLASPVLDSHMNLRSEISRLLDEIGIQIKYHHHEVGAAGQSEIEIGGGKLVETADRIQVVKYFIQMAAKRGGVRATFLPKPMYEQAGSGMHFHQQLFKNNKPVFYQKGGYGDLSSLALSYIAGILSHAPALSALTNPTTNSFRRLTPGFEAPVKLFFSLANRTAAIRIPKYATQPEEKRIEYRPPDGMCNPYLAMSAILLAGLEGISKKLDPARLHFGPFDENVFQSKREKLASLPQSLEEALEFLEKDHAFLIGVFDEDFLISWIDYMREKEIKEIKLRPHPYEIELYLDR